ncbi:MAG: hypothetical protein CL928_03740 [Deltaproteobacteria bacterium]|nr:hypothetical protein [Deltaproteobacteria bacterium]
MLQVSRNCTPTEGLAAFSLLCGLALCLSGCDGWPLYVYMEDELPAPDEAVAPELVELEEEALDTADSDPEDELVPVPATLVPSITLVHGELGSCGYDNAASWPNWPEHPVDFDGDGVSDGSTASHQGWYAAEVDVFQVAVSTDAELFVVLEWENSPSGGSNAPMIPDDSTAPWATESDLDFVLLSVVEGQLDRVVADAGVSLDYPQQLWAGQPIPAGESLAVAVGCHHGLPTSYSLTLELRTP